MSGIYKSLDKSDISVTPFKVYKRYKGSDTDFNAPYSFYEGVYAKDLKNLGATYPYIQDTDYTTDDKLKQAVHHSTDHLFYREFVSNNKATFGSGNINNQLRTLFDRVGVISIPQTNYGESVLPGSVEVVMPNLGGVRGLPTSVVFVDDANGNLVFSGSVYTGTPISQSNQVYRLQTEQGLQYLNITQSFSFYDFLSKYSTTTKVNSVFIETSSFGFSYGLTGKPSSSIVIIPATDDLNQAFNFMDQDYSIGMYLYIPIDSTSGPILEKKSPTEIGGVNANGDQIIYPISRYPYSLEYDSTIPGITFSKSNGDKTITMFVEVVAYNEWFYLTLSRSGSLYTMTTETEQSTLVDTLQDYNCSNTSKIYIGANADNTVNCKFNMDQLKFWTQNISVDNRSFLEWSSGSNSLNVGNVFYKQGMVTLTNPFCLNTTGSNKPTTVEHRATVGLYETSITCTISPGEFEVSNNPTLQVYDPRTNEFKLRGFATESAFKPYITQIGLYTDSNQLVVAGKLSQPVKVPGNLNTTFVVKYDT